MGELGVKRWSEVGGVETVEEISGGGFKRWSQAVEPSGGAKRWSQAVEPSGGVKRPSQAVEVSGGVKRWR